MSRESYLNQCGLGRSRTPAEFSHTEPESGIVGVIWDSGWFQYAGLRRAWTVTAVFHLS